MPAAPALSEREVTMLVQGLTMYEASLRRLITANKIPLAVQAYQKELADVVALSAKIRA